MKKNIKNLWVKALRSGEFAQTQGQLELNGSYCALGVLSALALINGICTFDERSDGGRFDNRRTTLSYNVMNWAGIRNYLVQGAGLVKFVEKGKESSIAELNDEGCDFIEIANLIEKSWKEL